jgi:hypothetical protein
MCCDVIVKKHKIIQENNKHLHFIPWYKNLLIQPQFQHKPQNIKGRDKAQ